MSAFLAFFPVSVGTLRGLDVDCHDVADELLRSYAATWRQTLFGGSASPPRSRRWCRRSGSPRPRP